MFSFIFFLIVKQMDSEISAENQLGCGAMNHEVTLIIGRDGCLYYNQFVLSVYVCVCI